MPLNRALRPCLGLVLALSTLTCQAGGFLFTSNPGQENRIAHPKGYTGQGGEVVVGVCLSPANLPSDLLLADVQGSLNKTLATWNALTPIRENLAFGADNDVPSGRYDIESVMLHELGHCIGLSHVNHSNESELPSAQQNGTRSTKGPNTVYNQATGPDNLHGSSDDSRGDDQPMYWFERNWADPDRLPEVIDFSTYSRTLSDLPPGHTFPSNADRAYLASRGIPNTESSLQQGQGLDEVQRQLTAEDVATLRLGMAGRDGVQGTPDDYTLRLVPSTSDCDIQVSFDPETSFAFCSVTGNTFATNRVQITTAQVKLSPNTNWYASPGPNTQVTLSSAQGNAWPANQPFTVRATVSKPGTLPPGLPPGAVTLRGSDGHECTAPLNAQGEATCAWPAQATAGMLTIAAQYPGHRGFDRSETTFTHTVNTPIAHSLSVVTDGGMVAGEPVTVRVRSSSALATGPITATHPHGLGCQGNLVQGELVCAGKVPTQAGTSSWALTYLGDARHPPRTTSFPSTVARAPTELVIQHPEVAYPGQALSFTATLAVGTASNPLTPTGVVTVQLGSVQCNVAPGGSCDLAVPTQEGVFTLTASYAGDANTAPTTSTSTVSVIRRTVPMTVQAPTAGWPTQSISFTPILNAQPAVTGQVTLSLGSSQCTTTPNLPCTLTLPATEGPATVSLAYAGDGRTQPATATHTLVVQRVTPLLTLLAPPTALPDSAVTVGVTSAPGGPALQPEVTFTLDGATCAAHIGSTCSLATPGEGDWLIQASYPGDALSNPVTLTQALDVRRQMVTLVVNAPAVVPVPRVDVQAIAQVNQVTVPGEVRVQLLPDGAPCVVSVPQPVCRVDLPGAGTHTLRISYEGSILYAPVSLDRTVQVVLDDRIFGGGFESD